MPATVLIAAVQHLASLKEREELVDTIMFSDAEALKALDVITRQRPGTAGDRLPRVGGRRRPA